MEIKNRKSRGLPSRNKATGRTKNKKNIRPAGWLGKNWDENKSAKYNYEKLGIAADPRKKGDTEFRKDAFDELVTGTEYVPTKNLVQDWQKEILTVLVKKHGSNYGAMAKDIKVNSWQWTKAQLKKMIELGVQ